MEKEITTRSINGWKLAQAGEKISEDSPPLWDLKHECGWWFPAEGIYKFKDGDLYCINCKQTKNPSQDIPAPDELVAIAKILSVNYYHRINEMRRRL